MACKHEESRRENPSTKAMFVRHTTQNNKAKHKPATNFTEAEGIALHKPGACEAKQGKQKLPTTKVCIKLYGGRRKSTTQTRCLWSKTHKTNYWMKQNTSVQQTSMEPREYHCTNPVFGRPTRKSKLRTKTQQKRVTNFTKAKGKAPHKSSVCEVKHKKKNTRNKAKHKRATKLYGATPTQIK